MGGHDDDHSDEDYDDDYLSAKKRASRQFPHPYGLTAPGVGPPAVYPYAYSGQPMQPMQPMTYAHSVKPVVTPFRTVMHGNLGSLGALRASDSSEQPVCAPIVTQHCIAHPTINEYEHPSKICYAYERVVCEPKKVPINFVVCEKEGEESSGDSSEESLF